MSKSPLIWKFLLILAVVAVAAFFSYPPGERISLGLDLKGGAHILMSVDTDGAVEYQMNEVRADLDAMLKEKGITHEAIVIPEPTTLAVRGTPPARSDEVGKLLEELVRRWEISNQGSGNWQAIMPQQDVDYYKSSSVDGALEIIRQRLDALGVGEPTVQKQGVDGDRILIQLPGVEDPERVKDLIKGGGVLEWKEVTYPPGVTAYNQWAPPDSESAAAAMFGGTLPLSTRLYPYEFGGVIRYWPLKEISTVSGSDLRNAFRSSDRYGSPAVSFELTQEAGRRFGRVTRENVGRVMAIILDGKVISAPTINSEISDSGIIQGGFSVTEAEDLAMKLRTGAIPAKMTIIEERIVGPSLGKDSIRSGVRAGVAGFVGVLLFMVVYYRFSGVNAVVALALNVLLVFGFLGALPFLFAGTSNLRATLTLPGIAGLILTVGMAVDSNVLIFERIREELHLGKTVRSAVDQGFSKAFVTIIDCNLTTVISAVFLGLYGTGPVRGFAVTLIIGLTASMFTAVFVSRQLFELVLSRGSHVESLSI